jgi:hypothetical protein
MEVQPTDVGPRYQSPKLTPHEQWRRPVTGLADQMLLGVPVVEHDAAANPNVSSRIDYLA